jgi:hypothetical protein
MRNHLFIALISIVAAAAFVVAVVGLTNGRDAAAQTSGTQILLSWRADTYVPPGFGGKALPTAGSAITAGIDAFVQGRRADLSGRQINWFLNEEFYRGGPGMARISFEAPNSIGGTTIQLRVVIPDYGNLARTVSIPVVTPEVVIGSSAPNLYATDAPFTLNATPYFFNVDDPLELQFSWALGGAGAVGGTPFTITGRMADDAGGPTRLELGVRNPSRPIERITRQLLLFPQ